MKKQLFFSLAIFLQIPFSYAQEKWNLKQCVDYAQEHNISVQRQTVQARMDQIAVNQSKLSQYPSVNFSNSLGLNTGRSIDGTTNQFTTKSIFSSEPGLQATVDVFNFFSKRNTIAAARYASEASRAMVEKLKCDIALNVAGAYLQALLDKQQAEIGAVQLRQTSAQLFNTRRLVQAGRLQELNSVQLEAQLARDSAGLITARANETQSLLYLKALLNLDAGTSFNIAEPLSGGIPLEPLSDLQPEAVYRSALGHLPYRQVTEWQVKAAQKSAMAIKGALFPKVSLSVQVQTGYYNSRNQREVVGYNEKGFSEIGVVAGSNEPVITPVRIPEYRYYATPLGRQLQNSLGNSVNINISVPIFNGGAGRANLQQARLKAGLSELQQKQEDQELKQDIYKAYNEAITALQKSHAALTSEETAQKAFDLATKRYELGLLNAMELITLQNNLSHARLQRLVARYEFVFKMKVLEFYKSAGLKW